MGGIGIVIVLICSLLTFLYYNSKKNNSKPLDKNQIQSGSSLKNGFDINKNQIKIELEKIRSKHLINLINYYVTLFSQTELDNQADRDRIAETYPKTLSREPFKFTFLYETYNVNLVNECILKMISESGDFDTNNSISEPFLKFEVLVKNEAELEARSIFDDFLRGKI